MKKINKRYGKPRKNIVPKYVTKRRVRIINNGCIVFDSQNSKNIPLDIQYTIRSYGIPSKIKPNNKTPLTYNVNTTLSSMFPTKEIEEKCLASFKTV